MTLWGTSTSPYMPPPTSDSHHAGQHGESQEVTNQSHAPIHFGANLAGDHLQAHQQFEMEEIVWV